MNDNLLLQLLIPMVAGTVYATTFYFIKKYCLKKRNILLEILTTFIRLGMLWLTLLTILHFLGANPVLMMILFVSSYLSTIAIISYNS